MALLCARVKRNSTWDLVDGPFSWWKRYINRLRNLQFLQNGRSVLCVDTNYINWVRGLGRKGLDLCTRCVYIPNYADTALLDPQQRDAPNYPGFSMPGVLNSSEARSSFSML